MAEKSMPKKILIVIESLAQGGAETLSVNLANGLAKRRNTVCFCAAQGPLRPKLDPGVVFAALPNFGFLSIAGILAALNRTIKSFKPDIIHSQNATHCLLVRLLFLFRAHPRLVFTYHSSKTARMPNSFSGFVFNFIADRIIAISELRRKTLLKTGIKSRKLYSVQNFVNVEEWGLARRSFDKKTFREQAGLGSFDSVLVTSARLIPEKNVDLFIKTVSEMSKMGKNVAGVIIGDGPERMALERIVRELKLEGKVFFTGFLENVRPYYFASDIFIFPTSHEVLPMVLIEACAAGLPVICSDIPGNDEIVKGLENGFLLSGNELEYSAKACALLDDNALYLRFSKNALRIARELFDEKNCISKTLEIYG